MYLLRLNQCKGGDYSGTAWRHTELLTTVTPPHGIVFTNDPTLMRSVITGGKCYGNARPPDGVALLEALFLHSGHTLHVGRSPEEIYEKNYKKLDLPIYEYSGLKNSFKKISFPSNQEILAIWKKVIKQFLAKYRHPISLLNQLYDMDMSVLKVKICYDDNAYAVLSNPINEDQLRVKITSLDTIATIATQKARPEAWCLLPQQKDNVLLPLDALINYTCANIKNEKLMGLFRKAVESSLDYLATQSLPDTLITIFRSLHFESEPNEAYLETM